MKIIRTSQGQQFQLLPQDPRDQNNPNIQQQNLQSAQSALEYFKNVIAASERAMTALREVEETMGTDIGFATQFQEMIKQAAGGSQAFNLLANMNFATSIDSLLDANQISSIETIINNNMQAMKSNMTPATY